MITGSVIARLAGFGRFQRAVQLGSGHPQVQFALRQWAARYRGFLQRRFDKFSKGGGDWPPLKRARRRGSKDSASILRDTNTLFLALSPGLNEGSVEEPIDGEIAILVGYGGPSRHPSGAATIADIASFHQVGGAFLPQRMIIVDPDQQTVRGMRDDMERALNKLGAEEVRKG